MVNIPLLYGSSKIEKIRYVHLKFSSSTDHWDYETNLPNKKHPNKHLSNYLEKEKTKAGDVIIDLVRDGKEYSINELVKRYKNESIFKTVFECYDERVKGLTKAGRIGNANVYHDTKNALKDFRPGNNLAFTDIDFNFLTKFVEHLQSKGNSPGGIGVRLRNLKALYNYAIDNNYVKREHYPFRNPINRSGFDISKYQSDPARKALTKEEIDKIRNLKIEHSSELYDSWNYFLFSYYMRGMSFDDIANLRKSDILGDHISYLRTKTGKRFVVKILEPAKEIINHYETDSYYLFPILNERHKTPISKKNRVKKILRKTNEDLKKIGNKAELDIPLTSYVARHTWANVVKNLGYSTSMISDAMGHKTEDVTRAYLESFKNDELDEMNEGIL